jgi:6-phosphogluconolactonase
MCSYQCVRAPSSGNRTSPANFTLPAPLQTALRNAIIGDAAASVRHGRVTSNMTFEILNDADAVAVRAAAVIATAARDAVAQRGKFLMAVSGGRTPWMMLRALADEPLPWSNIQVFQVDERIAPDGNPDRNLLHIRESLLAHSPLQPAQIHAMPVTANDLEEAARNYAAVLERIAGRPPVLDLVHLGLGPDGHTASLIPGDQVLKVADLDVALTGIYHGRRRMTLTYPVLNRSRQILWVVTGAEKSLMLKRLCDGDPSIPAGRISREHALVLADRAAV